MKQTSNLQLTKVPPGIPEVDQILHGGFNKNCLISLSVNSGTGKTIFCLQFLAGCAAEGRKTLVLSLEKPISQIKRTFRNYGIDANKLSDNLFTESYVPGAVKTSASNHDKRVIPYEITHKDRVVQN